MNNENEVKCWCCEHYWPYDEEFPNHCHLKNAAVSPDDTVCAEFLLNNALFTKRIIPDHCVNYKNKNRDERSVHPYKFTKTRY